MNSTKFILVIPLLPGLLGAQNETSGSRNVVKQSPEPPCKATVALLSKDGKPSWLTTQQLVERASHCEAPIFPPLAGTARIEGMVTLSVLVDEKGEVSCIKVITGHPLLLSGAIDAARKWKFRPMTEDGKPVGFYGVLRFHFSTSSADADRSSCVEAHW